MAQPRAEAHTFFKRLVSALVMIPPVLGAIYYGYPAFDLLIMLGFIILAYEWMNLCGTKLFKADAIIFYTIGLVALVLASRSQIALSVATLSSGAFYLFVVFFIGKKSNSSRTDQASQVSMQPPWLAIGFVYIGFSTFFLILLRHEHQAGFNIIILIFLVAWAADTGAYAFGRLIGGPKLAPVLSPNKTWAGFIGGVGCAALVGLGFALIVKESAFLVLVFGAAILGIISQCGDLLESRIKRQFQVKDAGSIIPGHGGLLDRVDSLLAMSWAFGLLYFLAREEVIKWMT